MKPLLGLHISTSSFNEEIFKFGTVQIFVGSPQTFMVGKGAVDFIEKYHNEFKIIVHSPYIINLVNTNHSMFPKTLSFTKEMAERFGNKIYGYNTHLGLVYTQKQLKEKVNESVDFGHDSLHKVLDELVPLYEKCGTKLILENAAGNTYGSDLSSVENLVKIVREYNSDSLKMCLDTCHSFGNGEITVKDIDKFLEIKDTIGAIHFNSIGKGEFGEHKDSHGDTMLTECTKYSFEDYTNFYKYIKDIPTILERDYDMGKKEFEMLTNDF